MLCCMAWVRSCPDENPQISPAGTAKCSPGRQSWVDLQAEESRRDGCKTTRSPRLSWATLSRPYGTFRSELAQTQHCRPGLHSAVPRGNPRARGQCGTAEAVPVVRDTHPHLFLCDPTGRPQLSCRRYRSHAKSSWNRRRKPTGTHLWLPRCLPVAPTPCRRGLQIR